MLALLTPIIPLLIKLVFMVLNSREGTKQLAKEFAALGSKIEKEMKTPANLRKSYDSQGDRLDELEKKN